MAGFDVAAASRRAITLITHDDVIAARLFIPRKIRRGSRSIPPANGNCRQITMTLADRVYDEDYASLI